MAIAEATAPASSPTPMRVLISASTFPLRIDDGIPRFVYDLAQELAGRCEVTVLAPDAPGAARRERMGRVDVHRFSYFAPRGHQVLAYGDGMGDNLRRSWLARLQVPGFVHAQARATRRLVDEAGIDVVNSHWILPQGLSTALARGASPRFRHVVTLHGGDVYMLRSLPFARSLARFVLRRADHVFAVSSNLRSELDGVLGRPSGAQLQPVGVRLGVFRGGAGQAPPSPFPEGYLLFVGRLVPIKGVDVLIRALPRIRERHAGLGLVVVGYGPEQSALRSLAADCGVERAVEFTGRRTHEEIARLLRDCRLVVLPSVVQPGGRAEGMPSVVVESMAAGARVVASAVGGIPDVIRDGQNGWLCRPGDPEALAQRVIAALDDPAGSAVVERARETSERFDWPHVAARYLEAYRGSPESAG